MFVCFEIFNSELEYRPNEIYEKRSTLVEIEWENRSKKKKLPKTHLQPNN